MQAEVPVATALYAPAAQGAHVAEDVARVTVLNLPAPHAVQPDVPVVNVL